MLSNEEKETLKNYYLNDYINTVRYILTFDPSLDNKYTISLKKADGNDDTSMLSISIKASESRNISNTKALNKDIFAILPTEIANEIIYEIRNDFAENHYIVYSSINKNKRIQTLQNEKFRFSINFNNDEEVEEALQFNSQINANKRHSTRVLKLF